MNGHRLLDGPIRLTLMFVLPRPAGHRTTKGDLSAEGKRHPWPDRSPDLDKLERAIGDALTNVVWRDDARIVQKESMKIYGDNPRIEIVVEPATPALPSDDAPALLRRLTAMVGDTSTEVNPDDHVAAVIHKLDRFGTCTCGRITDPLARFCPGCGKPTFSPYAQLTEADG